MVGAATGETFVAPEHCLGVAQDFKFSTGVGGSVPPFI